MVCYERMKGGISGIQPLTRNTWSPSQLDTMSLVRSCNIRTMEGHVGKTRKTLWGFERRRNGRASDHWFHATWTRRKKQMSINSLQRAPQRFTNRQAALFNTQSDNGLNFLRANLGRSLWNQRLNWIMLKDKISVLDIRRYQTPPRASYRGTA